MKQNQTEDDERRIRDAALDRTLAGTFPASDPPSTLPNPYDYSLVEEGPGPAPEDDAE